MIVRKTEITPIDFQGLSILDYTAKCNEQSSFAVITAPPNARHRLAWSKRSDKYYYMMERIIDFTINGIEYRLAKGDFCIIKKDDRFKYQNNTDAPASILLVHTPNFKMDEEVSE